MLWLVSPGLIIKAGFLWGVGPRHFPPLGGSVPWFVKYKNSSWDLLQVPGKSASLQRPLLQVALSSMGPKVSVLSLSQGPRSLPPAQSPSPREASLASVVWALSGTGGSWRGFPSRGPPTGNLGPLLGPTSIGQTVAPHHADHSD